MTTSEVLTGTTAGPPVSDTARVPASRLIRVELRKLMDTRAGMWLLIAIGLLTLTILTIVMFAADAPELKWSNFVGATATPQGILLPVLGIMLVTSEWGQRTALVTFTLEPHRGRVASAKLVAALIMGLLFVALALVLAALATGVAGAIFSDGGEFDYETRGLIGFVVLQLISVIQGVAFGMLIMNTAGAIVFYFALPTVWGILTSTVDWFADIGKWVDLNTTSVPLQDGTVEGEDWTRLAVSVAIWVLLPLVLGWFRLLHREVKSA